MRNNCFLKVFFIFCIFALEMRNNFQKITAVLLAFLLVFSTFSFAVEKHFCGDYLVDVSYLGNASLCSDTSDDSCDSKVQVKKKNCCKDEVLKVEGQQDIAKNTVEKFSSTNQLRDFVLPFTLSFLLFQEIQNIVLEEFLYVPPNLVFNFQTHYETYLI